MAVHTKHKGPAGRYALALLELANERNQAAEVAEDLRQIKEILQANPTFGLFLRDPGVGHAERQAALERIFKGHISPLLYNTLGVLNGKGRLGLLPDMADVYQQLLDEQVGKVDVDLIVARQLDEAELGNVRQRLGTALKREVVLHPSVDDSIIGGMVVRVQDKLMDASVKAQLEALRQKMLAAAPR